MSSPPTPLDPPSSADGADGFEPTRISDASELPASHDALPPGTRLGEYEVVGVLGEGGFGIVYLARDLALERLVAVKEYLPVALAARGQGAAVTLRAAAHAETFAAGLRSFINEGRLLARFDHPALVKVHRFWQENRTAYMAMSYYEGTTLQLVRRAMTRPPDEAWLRRLMLPLLGALEVLHNERCCHRDISPDNIMILPSGAPVLLDFGAARRIIEDRTQMLTAILKPAFAPIEQYAESSRVQQGPWTDLYALAAVMRFCLTGSAPLPATVRAVDDQMPGVAEITRTISTAFPDRPYSEAFVRGLDWALAVRPQDRPQSVVAWLNVLGDSLEPPTTVGRPLQAPARRPVPEVAASSLPPVKPRASLAAGWWPSSAPKAAVQPAGEEAAEAAVRSVLTSMLNGTDPAAILRREPSGEWLRDLFAAEAAGVDAERTAPHAAALRPREAAPVSPEAREGAADAAPQAVGPQAQSVDLSLDLPDVAVATGASADSLAALHEAGGADMPMLRPGAPEAGGADGSGSAVEAGDAPSPGGPGAPAASSRAPAPAAASAAESGPASQPTQSNWWDQPLVSVAAAAALDEDARAAPAANEHWAREFSQPKASRWKRLARWGGMAAGVLLVVGGAWQLHAYREAELQSARLSEAAMTSPGLKSESRQVAEVAPALDPSLDPLLAAARVAGAGPQGATAGLPDLEREPPAAGMAASSAAPSGPLPAPHPMAVPTAQARRTAPGSASTSAPIPATTPALAEPATTLALATVAPEPATPRAACGSRSQFSLLYCMQAQCKRSRYAKQEQCKRLEETGEVE